MPLHDAVEINFSVLVVEIDRERIRVTAITYDGEEAPVSLVKNIPALLRQERLLEPAHRPESEFSRLIHVK